MRKQKIWDGFKCIYLVSCMKCLTCIYVFTNLFNVNLFEMAGLFKIIYGDVEMAVKIIIIIIVYASNLLF